jgi:hypothetical protein
MQYEAKLLPSLREGIHLIKMILYKELRRHLREKYVSEEETFVPRLAGALINELFGTPNHEEPFLTFAQKHKAAIQEELDIMAETHPEFKILLTDALRVQFACDSQEGQENYSAMSRAKELGLLISERDFPLPHQFMTLVCNLGEMSAITSPQVPPERAE